jgi:ribosomal 30S subunit maturation factor RimM
MITEKELLSIGLVRRTRYKDLPPFVFVKRDGLFVPFRAEQITELVGEEVFVLRSDVQDEGDGDITWQDLVGYTIMDEGANGESVEVGKIAQVDESTINTLAILEDERMIPLHEDFITEIDEDAHVLRVQLPFAL